MGIGGAVLVALAVWAFIRGSRKGDDPDLGTISGQWIAEHRVQERESSNR